MGVVDGSIHWNGQDNFFDFIQFHAERLGMTREEYIAHYGTANHGINERDKKPGPDPYHRGLDDEEVEDKEEQIKKQAKMDDDDPDAYKEMPGDKEAREKGEVKTSKATKAYNKLYGEDLDEGTMSDIHQMAGEVKSEEEFIKRFFKEYGAKIKKTKDSEEWAKSLYNDMNESLDEKKIWVPDFESKGYQEAQDQINDWRRKLYRKLDDRDFDQFRNTMIDHFGLEVPDYLREEEEVNEKIKLIMKDILSKMVPAAFGSHTDPRMRDEIKKAVKKAITPILKKHDYIIESDVNERSAMGYDGHTGLFYFEGVPFTQERLDEVIAWLKETVIKAAKDLPKQFTYRPAIQIEDEVGGEQVTFDTNKIKYLEYIRKSFKGKLAHDEDFNESKQIGEANEQQDKMAFSQLERIIDYATMLRDRMAAGKGLDAWMYGKIVKAEDYLNTLYDVVDGDDGVVETQKMTNKDWKKIKKFNKHVTDSGEKFVMSYDDRIGTFLEPVEIVDEAFKFGKKNQYSIDDVNEAYGFWGTLELGGFKRREIEDCWHSAMAWLTESYRFSDAGALYYLNAKAGRWIADQVIENKGHKDVVDVLEDYATDAEWKKWSKEYNKYAQEEMMQEAANPVNEEDDKDKKSTDRGPLDDDKIETALKKKAEDTGVPIGIIRAVMRRGLAAWKSGHRPGANQQQWGYARVNAFLTKGEGTWGKADSDLAKEVRDGGHDKKLKKA